MLDVYIFLFIGAFFVSSTLRAVDIGLNSEEVNARLEQCGNILAGLQRWDEAKEKRSQQYHFLLNGDAAINAEKKELNEALLLTVANATAVFSRGSLLKFFEGLDKDGFDWESVAHYENLSEKENVSSKTTELERLFELLRKHSGLSRSEEHKFISWNAANPDLKIVVTAPEDWTIRSLGGTTKLMDDKALYPIRFNGLVGELISASRVDKTLETIEAYSKAYSKSSRKNLAYLYSFVLSVMRWFYLKSGYEPWHVYQTKALDDLKIVFQALLILELNTNRAVSDFEKLLLTSESGVDNASPITKDHLLSTIELWLHFSPQTKWRLIRLLAEVMKRFPIYRESILLDFLDLHLAWLDNPESFSDGHPLRFVKDVLKYEDPVQFLEDLDIQTDLLQAMLYETVSFSENAQSKNLTSHQIFLEGAKKVRADPSYGFDPDLSVKQVYQHFSKANFQLRAAAREALRLLEK